MDNTRYGKIKRRRKQPLSDLPTELVDELEERQKPPWSDLPTELVELVLQNCNFSDQARLRAICRRWQSIPRVQPLSQQLPWVMAYDHRNWSTCKLFDLTYKKTYTVNISNIKEYYQEKNPDQYMWIHASKSGWLLLRHTMCENPRTAAFFLFSPFTNRMIQLPNLQTANFSRLMATLSADPNCADCIFFVLHNSIHADTVSASTCRLGDTTWTTQVFPGCFDAIDNVVYSQGLFWCATAGGSLATFSVAQGIWNVVLESLLPPLKDTYLVGSNGNLLAVMTSQEDRHVFKLNETYLVESNGNLLLIITSLTDRHVFKLDRSLTAWFLKEDGDEALFLGPTPLSVSTTVAAKFGESGKIHDIWGSKCTFFFRNSNMIYGYPECYDLLSRDYFLSKIWIEPPS